ncbi:aldo/keto reductase [Desulfopila sp. IMCC35008]|uniref:aldo/keto reductase n=1 Tax=Desulfopila sp. IMCC35008 TaxID=2653858 RepID=UPI0013D71691|nr:aldo/keto reductase [Desulfopila sp. IMCC35008]
MKRLKFSNGDMMPALGLGTWKSPGGQVYKAVLEALQCGYQHIDCAPIYGNEPEVGKALQESFDRGVTNREEVWVTSKLWNNSHHPESVEPALQKTLDDLHLDYLDLFLIHWPVHLQKGVTFASAPSEFIAYGDLPIAETWRAMEELVKKGLCKHIGVSNFSRKKLSDLTQQAHIQPEMNQVELHPYLQQPGMVEFCRANGIHLTAYSPLGSPDRPQQLKQPDEPILMQDPVIKRIAGKHRAAEAQVLISWAMHRGTAVIPKSVTPERISANLKSTEITLTPEEVEEINGLNRNRRYVSGAFWTGDGSPYTQDNLWDGD